TGSLIKVRIPRSNDACGFFETKSRGTAIIKLQRLNIANPAPAAIPNAVCVSPSANANATAARVSTNEVSRLRLGKFSFFMIVPRPSLKETHSHIRPKEGEQASA